MTHEPVRDDELPPDPFEQKLEMPAPELAAARAKCFTLFAEFLDAAQKCIAIDPKAELHADHWGWVRPRLGIQLEIHRHAGPNIITVTGEFPMDDVLSKQEGDTNGHH